MYTVTATYASDHTDRWVGRAKTFLSPVLRKLDAEGKSYVQKVLEEDTVQFYKRDRDGTGGLPRERYCTYLKCITLYMYCMYKA
jgi:hypothetical protein